MVSRIVILNIVIPSAAKDLLFVGVVSRINSQSEPFSVSVCRQHLRPVLSPVTYFFSVSFTYPALNVPFSFATGSKVG